MKAGPCQSGGRLSGGCLCGDVRFEAATAPVAVVFCHCRTCRRQTGAPVAAFVDFRRADVRFSGAEPARFASSPGVERGFCARCGSSLFFAGDATPDLINIHLGAMDDPQDFVPADSVHEALKLPWLCVAATGCGQ